MKYDPFAIVYGYVMKQRYGLYDLLYSYSNLTEICIQLSKWLSNPCSNEWFGAKLATSHCLNDGLVGWRIYALFS